MLAQQQRFLNKIESRLVALLKEEEDPKETMIYLGRKMIEEGMMDRLPPTTSAQAFAAGVLENEVAARRGIVLQGVWNPEAAETAEDLIVHLLPLDDHLR